MSAPSAKYEDGLTPAVLEELIRECIARKDFEGVRHCLTVLAARDPERAEIVLGVIKLGLAVGAARHEAERG